MTDDATEWTDDPAEATSASDLRPKEPGDECNARTGSGGYCKHESGWGVPDKSSGRCKLHGGLGGAPRGEANGNYKHGLYSEELSEGDAERAQRWIDMADGDRLSLTEFSVMFEKLLLYEFTRLERAMAIAPDPGLAHKWACGTCGYQVASQQQAFCPGCEAELSPADVVPTGEWVDMHDRSVSERADSLADMIETYKDVTEGSDLNLHGHVEVDFETALRRAQDLAADQEDDADAYSYTRVDVEEPDT